LKLPFGVVIITKAWKGFLMFPRQFGELSFKFEDIIYVDWTRMNDASFSYTSILSVVLLELLKLLLIDSRLFGLFHSLGCSPSVYKRMYNLFFFFVVLQGNTSASSELSIQSMVLVSSNFRCQWELTGKEYTTPEWNCEDGINS